MSTMFWIWMAAGLVFLILEIISPTLFFVCFAAGAVVSGVYSYFSPESYYLQTGIFIIVSVGLIPITRRFAKKISTEQPEHANVDRMLGKTGLVTKQIEPDTLGQVRFEGEVWAAQASESIEEHARVRITRVSGTKVTVERV